MNNTNTTEFFETYVNPYYGGLMNMNLTEKEIVPNTEEFIDMVIGLEEKLSREVIKDMLFHENWRQSKVAAWIIGLCQMEDLYINLVNYLTIKPIYCEHALISLCLFDNQTIAVALNDFVLDRLDALVELIKEGKQFEAIDRFQSNSIVWGFRALNYHDSINESTYFADLLNSPTWMELKTHWLDLSKSNSLALKFYNLLAASEVEDLRFVASINKIKEAAHLG